MTRTGRWKTKKWVFKWRKPPKEIRKFYFRVFVYNSGKPYIFYKFGRLIITKYLEYVK